MNNAAVAIDLGKVSESVAREYLRYKWSELYLPYVFWGVIFSIGLILFALRIYIEFKK